MARAFEAKRFAINWVRGDNALECISSSQLAGQVESTLGPVFVAPADAEFFIEAMIDRDDDDFVARVAVSDGQGRILGQRELRGKGPDCRKLDAQLIFVITMTIDPEIALERLPPELLGQFDDSADPAADLLADVRANARSEPKDEDRRSRGAKAGEQKSKEGAVTSAGHIGTGTVHGEAVPAAKRWRFTASGGAALGGWVMPELSIGPHFGLAAVTPDRWSIELSAVWWPIQTVSADEQPGPVAITSVRSDLGLCLPVWEPGVIFSACGALTLTYLFTSTGGDLEDLDALSLQVGPTLEGRAQIPLSRWLAARTGVAIHFPLNRERFVYRDLQLQAQPVFKPGWGELTGHLDLVWTP